MYTSLYTHNIYIYICILYVYIHMYGHMCVEIIKHVENESARIYTRRKTFQSQCFERPGLNNSEPSTV